MQYFPKQLKGLKNFNRGGTCSSGCKDFLLDQHLSTLPSTFWHCSIWVAISSFSNLCSTLFLLSMTFERFYSIIRPHRAVLLNTVKRAKITIACVVLFCVLFNIPHLFTTIQRGKDCNPIGKAVDYPYLQIYFLVDFSAEFLSAIFTFTHDEECNYPYLKAAGKMECNYVSRSK